VVERGGLVAERAWGAGDQDRFKKPSCGRWLVTAFGKALWVHSVGWRPTARLCLFCPISFLVGTMFSSRSFAVVELQRGIAIRG